MNTNKSVVAREHGRQKYNCVLCGVSGICPHGKRKSRCLPCGGIEICEHNMLKSRCLTQMVVKCVNMEYERVIV
jgi:hypothetical protein